MKSILALAILLLIPLALAFHCGLTADENYCKDIGESDLNDSEKDLVFSSLLYQDQVFPNHDFIRNYNLNIEVIDPPYNTTKFNSRYIKDAWLSFLAVFPSVYENDSLFVPFVTNGLSVHDHWVLVPDNYVSPYYPLTNESDCKRTYSLIQNEPIVRYYLNNIFLNSGDFAELNIDSNGAIRSELTINTNIKVDHYSWQSYCCSEGKNGCKKMCHRCIYDYTHYEPDKIILNDEKKIFLYSKTSNAGIEINNQYRNTTKGRFWAKNYSYFRLNFSDSFISKQQYAYDIIFEKRPYFVTYLRARNFSHTATKNIFLANDTFFVKNAQNCSISLYNHFYNKSLDCNLTLNQEELKPLRTDKKKLNWSFLIKATILILILYFVYRICKGQFEKLAVTTLLILLILPVVSAQSEEECGITNLASCLPQKMYEYALYIINLPLLPMLTAVKNLLTADVSTEVFIKVWSMIRYLLSFFYVFLFIYSGYLFMTSNDNPIKRGHAKDVLKNTVIMIVLIQASYYLYNLILGLSIAMNSAILKMIDPTFFLLTADNITNIGLEFLMAMGYGTALFFTMLMLVLRYLVVSFGVVIFPIGLFLYFIPPLKPYGRFLLNLLGIFIFITFFDLLIILACSMLIEIPLFANIKIIVMITCFAIVNYTLYLAIKFALTKSANSSIKDDLNQAVKYIGMVV